MIQSQLHKSDPSKLVCPVFGCLLQIENKPEQKLFQKHVLQCIQHRNMDTHFYGRSRKYFICPLNHVTSVKDNFHNICRAATIYSGYRAQILRTILKKWICFPKPSVIRTFNDQTIATFYNLPFDNGTLLQGQANCQTFKSYMSSQIFKVIPMGSDRVQPNKRKPRRKLPTQGKTENSSELVSQHANFNMYSNVTANCEEDDLNPPPPKKQMTDEFTRFGHNGSAPVTPPHTVYWKTDISAEQPHIEVIESQSTSTRSDLQPGVNIDNLKEVTIQQTEVNHPNNEPENVPTMHHHHQNIEHQ